MYEFLVTDNCYIFHKIKETNILNWGKSWVPPGWTHKEDSFSVVRYLCLYNQEGELALESKRKQSIFQWIISR